MRVLSSARSWPCSWATLASSSARPGTSLPLATSFAFSVKASFFLSLKRSLNPMASSSFAKEFDQLGGTRARVAQRDHAVVAQDRLLAAQDHLGVAVDRDVGAVGAAIDDGELALAPLDLAVGARGHAVRDHQV